MKMVFDIEKVKALLKDFNIATGIRIDLMDADFSPISYNEYENNNYCNLIQSTSTGKKACLDSDIFMLKKCKESKCTQKRICHAGLVDLAVPIIYEEEILGYLIFGQMRDASGSKNIENYIQNIGLDTEIALNFYNSLPLFDSVKIESVSNIAVLLVKYILLEDMLKPSFDDNIQRAVNYINKNLDKELSVKSISKNANVSKSVLYKNFHKHFNSTVSEYINSKRIDKSLELLVKTDYTIEEISQKVGFLSVSYYSRTFKKQIGISPLKYRKANSHLLLKISRE